MPARQACSPSRRFFLGSIVAGATAAVQGATFLQQPAPDESSPDDKKDQVRVCDLNGILPAPHVTGGVLVVTATDGYFVFDAEQFDDVGEKIQAGSGVWCLQKWCARKFRLIGDESYAVHPVDFSKLEDFCTYEVFNSTWIDILVDGNRSEASKLHHYIVTLDSVTAFECVVEKLDASISTLPFWDLHAWMLEISGVPEPFNQGFLPPEIEAPRKKPASTGRKKAKVPPKQKSVKKPAAPAS